MISRKLAALGLTLALGIAGAHAAQPAGQSPAAAASGTTTTTATTAPQQPSTPATEAKSRTVKIGVPAKVGTSAKIGTPAKIGTKSGPRMGMAKLHSGRSVAAPVAASHRLSPAHRRLHLAATRLKRLHRAHVAAKLGRTHVAHVAKKGPAKHA